MRDSTSLRETLTGSTIENQVPPCSLNWLQFCEFHQSTLWGKHVLSSGWTVQQYKMAAVVNSIADTDSEDELPAGWEERVTADGRVYYAR